MKNLDFAAACSVRARLVHWLQVAADRSRRSALRARWRRAGRSLGVFRMDGIASTRNGPRRLSSQTQLVAVDGKLYGTSLYGGAYGAGTVFRITTRGAEKVLYSFGKGYGDGPSSIVSVDSTLYGTSSGGGAYGKGTVFRITTSGKENVP